MNWKEHLISTLLIISLLSKSIGRADPPKLEYPETLWHFAGRDWLKHHKLVHKFQWPQMFDHFIDPLIPKKLPPTRRRRTLDDLLQDIGDLFIDWAEE